MLCFISLYCAWNMHVPIKKCDCEHCVLISTLNLEALNSLFLRQIRFFQSPIRVCKAVENFIPKKDCWVSFIDLSKSIKGIIADFSMLRQGKFMFALWALGKSTLYRGWTARTSKGSAICYVKGKTTLRTSQYVLRPRIHSTPSSLNQPPNDVLKTFPEA